MGYGSRQRAVDRSRFERGMTLLRDDRDCNLKLLASVVVVALRIS